MPRARTMALPRPTLIAAFLRDESGALWKKALLVFSVAYVLFPVDLVPDLIPIWGWLDDAGVMTVAAMFLSWAVAPYEAKAKPRTGSLSSRIR